MKDKLGIALLVVVIAAGSLVVARADTTPDEWLQKMSTAVETLDYEGTVIRGTSTDATALKVVHKKIDGVVNERIVVQEGSPLEVIRVGDEVHCIVPHKKKVLVETWDTASSLFATLPRSTINPGSQYDVLILSYDERVAGRGAVKLAIRPIDSDRYEHRYWLDTGTGFPLRAETIDLDGNVVEQLKFADIRIAADINKQSLAPSMLLADYTWYTTPGKESRQDVESEWVSSDLPRGFETVSVSRKKISGSEAPVTHIVFSDGLASVSVFISEAGDGGREPGESDVRGAANSFSTEVDGHRITAVGEVPASTVRAIASSMRRP